MFATGAAYAASGRFALEIRDQGYDTAEVR